MSSIRPLAAGVIEYQLALASDDAALTWRPGQFISITCGAQANGEPLLRSYSIASRPLSGSIHLVVKLIDGGPASEWFRTLPVGADVVFTGPMGFFVLDATHPGDVVFAATGTGIAPEVPMILETLARSETGRVHLAWGLRSEEDLFWRRELAAIRSPRFDAAIYLSRAGDAWRGLRGRIIAPVVALLPSLSRPTFYLCGNGAMIKELKTALVERGVDRKKSIRTEAFFD